MSSRSRSARRSSSRACANRDAAAGILPHFVAGRVEQRDDVEAVVAEARVVGERQAEVAGAQDDDLELAIEAEDLAQVPAQVLDVVADAADAELAELGEVLADLGGVEAELLGQAAGRHGVDASRLEGFERSQIDRQSRGRELGDRLAVGALAGRPFHRPYCSRGRGTTGRKRC